MLIRHLEGCQSEKLTNGQQASVLCSHLASKFGCMCITGIAYMHKGKPVVAIHHGMPFGATASVVAWHNVGALLQKVARVMLLTPVYRYVDDYFAAERFSN